MSESWDILREYQAMYPHKILGERVELPHALGYQARTEQAEAKAAETPAEAEALPALDLTGDHGLTDDQMKLLRELAQELHLIVRQAVVAGQVERRQRFRFRGRLRRLCLRLLRPRLIAERVGQLDALTENFMRIHRLILAQNVPALAHKTRACLLYTSDAADE